jgi:hypothetical protein
MMLCCLSSPMVHLMTLSPLELWPNADMFWKQVKEKTRKNALAAQAATSAIENRSPSTSPARTAVVISDNNTSGGGSRPPGDAVMSPLASRASTASNTEGLQGDEQLLHAERSEGAAAAAASASENAPALKSSTPIAASSGAAASRNSKGTAGNNISVSTTGVVAQAKQLQQNGMRSPANSGSSVQSPSAGNNPRTLKANSNSTKQEAVVK